MIVPFLPIHLKDLVVHEYMGYIQDHFSEEYGELLSEGEAFTCLRDGKVIACGGVYPMTENRHQAWALFSSESGSSMAAITRKSKQILSKYNSRVETHVRCDFDIGQKWMDMLEFVNETPNGMKRYGEDGFDYYLYARA